jgi:hypothetical protein
LTYTDAREARIVGAHFRDAHAAAPALHHLGHNDPLVVCYAPEVDVGIG